VISGSGVQISQAAPLNQGFHKIYIHVSLIGLHWGYKVYDSKDTYNHWNFIYSCWSIIPIFERYWVGKTAR
ncbi:MAG: hypothetical protein ACJ0G5_04280, partial [Alphaproteobacteria bacterium]